MSLTTLISLVNELWTLVLPSEPLRRTTTRNITNNSITNSANSTNLLYELQPVIEGLSVSFCRYVVVTGSLTTTHSKSTAHSTQSSFTRGNNSSSQQHGINQHWEWIFRTFISLLLGSMAYYNIGYDYIYALHLWSHALPAVLIFFNSSAAAASLRTRERNIKKKLASRHGNIR
jgi:hypothetical protein